MDAIKNSIMAFGVIEPSLFNATDARIKVLGTINNGMITRLSDADSKKAFPPYGYTYAYKFYEQFPELDEYDLVQFRFAKVEKKFEDWDDFKVIHKPERLGCPLLQVKHFINNYNSIDLSVFDLPDNFNKSKFYILAQDRFVMGKLSAREGKINNPPQSIQKWDKESTNFIKHNNKCYLLEEPNLEESVTMDCLTNTQLVKWFRNELKELKPEWVEYLDKNSSWRTEMPTKFQSEDELGNIRLRKIMNALDSVELDKREIQGIIEASDKFKQIFIEQVDSHKEAFLKEHNLRIEELEKDAVIKQRDLDQGLSKIKKQLRTEQQKLTEIEIRTRQAESLLAHLNSDKARLLADFSILNNLVSTTPPTTSPGLGNNFILEHILPESKGHVGERDTLIERTHYYLDKYGVAELVSGEDALDTILIHCGTIVSRIEIALSLIEAFANTTYIIQQTEVDWLHFRNLWENGLSEIWTQAEEHPDRLHILILQDVNLASPECYAKPLLDIFSGIRRKIPYIGKPLPSNLRVIASKISTQNPQIGLPLYRETFVGWGQAGFDPPIVKRIIQSDVNSYNKQYCDASDLQRYMPDPTRRNAIIASNKTFNGSLYDY